MFYILSLSKHNVIVGLLIIVGIIVLVLLISFFKPNKPVKDIYFDKYMALKDSMVIHALNDAKDYKVLYESGRKQDSATMANLISSQKIFTQRINESLKNIPINILRISGNDDSIRSAFSKY